MNLVLARDEAAVKDEGPHFRELHCHASLHLEQEPQRWTELQRDAIYRRSLALADALGAAISLGLVIHLLSGERLKAAAMALPFVMIGFSKIIGLYERDELVLHKATLDEAPALLQLATLFTVLVWLLESVLVQGVLNKPEYLALAGISSVAFLVCRAIARKTAARLAPKERCLLLGDETALRRLQEKLNLRGYDDLELIGRLDIDEVAPDQADLRHLGQIIRNLRVQRVIIAPRNTESDGVLSLIRETKAARVKVSLVPRFSEVLGSSVVFDDLNGMAMLSIRRFGLTRSSRLLKRALDILLTGLLMLGAAPCMALVALATKLDSGGNLLFRQIRIGRGGRPFEMLKFRTMVEGANERKAALEPFNEADGLFKIADDPRITRVGRLVRRASLDELPQLINVLRGDMSLVGPRPLVEEDDSQIVGWHRRRLDLTPGITGHWQILGSARVPLHEMVAIDYLYIVNWSLWTDLKLLLRTVPHVLCARGQ